MQSAKVEPYFNIYALSECAITVELGQSISEDVFKRVTDFNSLVNENPFSGFITSVPAYTTVTVFYDVLAVSQSVEMAGADCFEKVTTYLASLNTKQHETITASGNKITIPLCYGGKFGPDLEEVAAHHNLTVEGVISLHSSATYKVYMIGFVPGFAYLGGMNKELAMPRKPTPRNVVPAGSVGIAGEQTGIYPLQTPGGWQIIGRTPLKMFDVNAQQAGLLKAGYTVTFQAITEQEFNDMANAS